MDSFFGDAETQSSSSSASQSTRSVARATTFGQSKIIRKTLDDIFDFAWSEMII